MALNRSSGAESVFKATDRSSGSSAHLRVPSFSDRPRPLATPRLELSGNARTSSLEKQLPVDYISAEYAGERVLLGGKILSSEGKVFLSY